jgi:beta-mannosidase
MSEFGFQSFPEFNTVKKYAIEEDWDIKSEVMESHQRSSIGNATIEEYLFRDYRKPKNFEQFLYVGQLLQARGIRSGIEAHRRAMPYCMGTLYWQINDCWPVASWSSTDYYGNWKALHYAARDAFKKIILSFEVKNDNLHVFIISDALKNTVATLNLSSFNFHGEPIFQLHKELNIEGNKSSVYVEEEIGLFTNGNNPNELFIQAVLIGENGSILDERIYYLEPPKDLLLTDSQVKINIESTNDNAFLVKISTDKLAKDIYLNTQFEGFFSDNYFDLPPGDQKDVLFTCKEPIDETRFKNDLKILSLIDSYK